MEEINVFDLLDKELIRSAKEEADQILAMNTHWKPRGSKTAVKTPKKISSYTTYKDWVNLSSTDLEKEVRILWNGINYRCN